MPGNRTIHYAEQETESKSATISDQLQPNASNFAGNRSQPIAGMSKYVAILRILLIQM